MHNPTFHTPSSDEIAAGMAAGRYERSAAFWNALAAFCRIVRRHFEWRASINRLSLTRRCPDCGC